MSTSPHDSPRMDSKKVKEVLVAAGIEVYRTRPAEVHVAERIRLHIMDSGIRVVPGDPFGVAFTVRSQRSDFPEEVEASSVFDRLREVVGAAALSRGYAERGSSTTPVKDPSDGERLLDVWHDITFEKAGCDADAMLDEVRWALGLERYIGPSGSSEQ